MVQNGGLSSKHPFFGQNMAKMWVFDPPGWFNEMVTPGVLVIFFKNCSNTLRKTLVYGSFTCLNRSKHSKSLKKSQKPQNMGKCEKWRVFRVFGTPQGVCSNTSKHFFFLLIWVSFNGTGHKMSIFYLFGFHIVAFRSKNMKKVPPEGV